MLIINLILYFLNFIPSSTSSDVLLQSTPTTDSNTLNPKSVIPPQDGQEPTPNFATPTETYAEAMKSFFHINQAGPTLSSEDIFKEPVDAGPGLIPVVFNVVTGPKAKDPLIKAPISNEVTVKEAPIQAAVNDTVNTALQTQASNTPVSLSSALPESLPNTDSVTA
jgi:hypothetical protein